MPVLKNIRFQKYDDYSNPVFMATSKEDESANYETLKIYSEKLINREYGTFMPIYHNEEYEFSTIRFMKNSNFRPKNNCVYDLDFTIKMKSVDKEDGDEGLKTRTYINCYINSLKFVSKMEYDEGEVIEL